MAMLDVEQTMSEFLATVDLPRVNPQELIEEAVLFLKSNGIMESWHLVGLTTAAFKKDSFKDAFMIGAASFLVLFLCACSRVGSLRFLDACVKESQQRCSATAAGLGSK